VEREERLPSVEANENRPSDLEIPEFENMRIDLYQDSMRPDPTRRPLKAQ
jgi:hypothetical protein